jgi:outer membrane receptor for Fe3+-dicitrate
MRRLALVLQLVTLSTASAASGQPPDEPLTRLPPVRVTAPAPFDPLARPTTPSRVDTVVPDGIVAPRASVLPDVLERLPGVILQNEQGTGFSRA